MTKKGPTHGARHGKTEEQKEYHMAWVYRESQLAIGWSEQKCKEMNELAKEDRTYHLSPEEYRSYH